MAGCSERLQRPLTDTDDFEPVRILHRDAGRQFLHRADAVTPLVAVLAEVDTETMMAPRSLILTVRIFRWIDLSNTLRQCVTYCQAFSR